MIRKLDLYYQANSTSNLLNNPSHAQKDKRIPLNKPPSLEKLHFTEQRKVLRGLFHPSFHERTYSTLGPDLQVIGKHEIKIGVQKLPQIPVKNGNRFLFRRKTVCRPNTKCGNIHKNKIMEDKSTNLNVNAIDVMKISVRGWNDDIDDN
ncbi:hypothetical protein SteCoe_11627 [Stentor coeruleus]|uniref:Uncharacterized protein n=1 Tax=Stentor coeruleus TaxID=5963 RepID=A0A1R2CCP9_9CILI|nr:hypothetical protein SteCoe_11627 [Stentor coeruleus]